MGVLEFMVRMVDVLVWPLTTVWIVLGLRRGAAAIGAAIAAAATEAVKRLEEK